MREPPDAALEEQLFAARADFARALPPKAADIEAFVSGAAWDSARRAAHKLRGSAAVYGFAGLSAAAGRLEDLLLAAQGSPDFADRAAIDEVVREVTAAARAGSQHE